MECYEAHTRKQQHVFLSFLSHLYQSDPYFRNENTYLLRQLFRGESPFCRGKTMTPVLVTEGGQVMAETVYITAEACPALMLAFLEVAPGGERALDLIFEEARRRARRTGLTKLWAGVNGHLNYGLGFLKGELDGPPTFGSSYHPNFYVPMLRAYGMRETAMTSYRWEMPPTGLSKYDAYCHRLESKYTFRSVSARHLRTDAALYTRLSNLCFAGHAFYYPRTEAEDYETLKELLLLAGEEFLLFAFSGAELVGLVLWYPDFNQLLPPGGKIGPRALLSIKLHPRRAIRMKLAELAVHPDHAGRGLPVCLLRQVAARCGDRFRVGESSWVLDENALSAALTQGLGGVPQNHYVAFEMDVSH